MRIGVLALQGGSGAHERMLTALGHEPSLLKSAPDFAEIAGLVLPGGESSVQLSLLGELKMVERVRELAGKHRPILATCAGLVLCARRVLSPEQASLGLLDVTVERNAWGTQVDSFEARSDDGRPLTFIRAPRIVELGAVEVLATFHGEPVLVQQGSLTAATYHPELTGDASVHECVFGRGS